MSAISLLRSGKRNKIKAIVYKVGFLFKGIKGYKRHKPQFVKAIGGIVLKVLVLEPQYKTKLTLLFIFSSFCMILVVYFLQWDHGWNRGLQSEGSTANVPVPDTSGPPQSCFGGIR